ncbi:hypothetical protein [Nonomuraea sp. NPDC023979]|uniref:hypothetical protein n=1 Tax=Nonomuraea sp. NPDC023979 TaxID=3154796 RepID=UPI0033D29DF1
MPSPGSDYRRRIAEAIRAAADCPIVAEWICCDPVNPDHDLCVKGDIARQMLRAVLADDEEKLYLPSGIVDAVLAVRDEELERAVAHDRQPYPTQWAYNQACAALEKHRARADQAEAERDTWRDLVRELVDDGPCEYDHHDQCQGHSLDSRPCPHGRAKELLAKEES